MDRLLRLFMDSMDPAGFVLCCSIGVSALVVLIGHLFQIVLRTQVSRRKEQRMANARMRYVVSYGAEVRE